MPRVAEVTRDTALQAPQPHLVEESIAYACLYVRCVRSAGHELLAVGAMSRADRIATVRAAAQSPCGD